MAKVKQWTITLDTYTVVSGVPGYGASRTTHTRMRAPYVNKDGFRFEISGKTFFGALVKAVVEAPLAARPFVALVMLLFLLMVLPFILPSLILWEVRGMRKIKVEYPELGRDLIIEANDESKLRALLANPKIRELIQAEPKIHFARKGNKLEFNFGEAGVITDVARLKSVYELFVEMLNQLVQIGSASEEAPNIVR